MTRILKPALAAAFFAVVAGAAQSEIYLRNGAEEIDVHIENDKLFCTRVEDGYELCNGLSPRTDGTWAGRRMQHPDMSDRLRFNGTVTFGDSGLTIRGCAVGICDAEDWPKT
ncbi:MAG: hypothetical protein GY717_05675 [Rhodobacteraceae bacterium]|nr:hypothetical protein [Paracoccaceae bacterium]